ncbi:DUF3095 domain-containing protein [Shimia sp. R10_1]|uniref:DUF3095 domain-containing protein n=1 Tax=Shimia sp. R10_1 TaxID=2821095 RepID=UPI001ADD52A0|nr:DUF3095 domain-containing protein [Shimia sp. R10_1]MBO9474591.1 DUF3095 domain-containing protein [Shimia sp. R10_1]
MSTQNIPIPPSEPHPGHGPERFYEALPRFQEFDRMAEPSGYAPLPEDWVVGAADIVGSTEEIAKGRYKAVNLVGAAVISAQLNAAKRAKLPYVFGGDGAQFAVWPGQRAAAEAALDAVRHWAWQEYGLRLRVAMATVGEIRAVGQDVRVARYAPAEGVDYASFAGGGLTWLESEMKAGRFAVVQRDASDVPDLSGLSCQWANMEAARGAILSLVMEPQECTSEADFAEVAQAVIAATQTETRGAHPVPADGPKAVFPPPGLALEAHIRPVGPLWWRKAKATLVSAFLWGLLRSGRRLGQFDPVLYTADVARNADYQKFDDGLKMTLDCDAEMRAQIEAILQKAQARGLIHYGMHVQDAAMMTCIVPAPVERTHMHFVDGAAGGYALAMHDLRMRAA